MEALSIPVLVNLSALGLGLLLGALVQRTDFCTMGAISDWVLMGDSGRLRAWLLAIGVAILGSQALHIAGLIDLGGAIYSTANFGWAGALIGGALFGFGMTLAGGCGSRSLARLGAGNLKSLVALLVLGVFAYMTLRGLFAPARLGLEAALNLDLKAAGAAGQGLPDLLGLLGLPAERTRPVLAVLLGGGLMLFTLADKRFRARPRLLIGGTGMGLLVVAGWAVTGILGNDDFDPTPLASITFVAPVGDSLIYLMTFTGAKLSFGISTVIGVVLGAFFMASAQGRFRIESFASRQDLQHHLLGGALMGTGGVLALGCTIGQGLTGLSTLALGSLLAFAGIVGGCLLALRYLEDGTLRGAVKSLFGAY